MNAVSNLVHAGVLLLPTHYAQNHVILKYLNQYF